MKFTVRDYCLFYKIMSECDTYIYVYKLLRFLCKLYYKYTLTHKIQAYLHTHTYTFFVHDEREIKLSFEFVKC